MSTIPAHDGTDSRVNPRLVERLPLQIGHLLSATLHAGRVPILPARLSIVGTHGLALYRRWSGLQWGQQVRFGEVEEIRLDEENIVRAGRPAVLHHFDFLGSFGRFRVSGLVDEHGHATDDGLYHFGAAALRAFRRYAEEGPLS